MNGTAVQIKDVSVTLSKHYQALKHVSVNLPSGKVIGFIGPSGAGKTTLIRAIVGRQRLSGGTITIDGLPAGATKLRSQLSYMTQETSIYNDLTVHENLAYFASMFGVARQDTKEAIATILHTVALDDHEKQLVGKLSGGQKQRVSLAIALIGQPKLMVLDEPTVGLDPVLREQLWQLFRKLTGSGTTLIISSHVMDEAERCDDLLLIRNGELLAHGSPEALRKQTGTRSIEQSFLKLVEEER